MCWPGEHVSSWPRVEALFLDQGSREQLVELACLEQRPTAAVGVADQVGPLAPQEAVVGPLAQAAEPAGALAVKLSVERAVGPCHAAGPAGFGALKWIQ